MGRLIDADAIVEYVRKYSPISDGADLLETWLEYAPTVDAVPVVHCRDCKYWDTFPSSTLAPDHHECKRIRIHTTAEWFCAAGERKDGEQHV